MASSGIKINNKKNHSLCCFAGALFPNSPKKYNNKKYNTTHNLN